VDRPVALVTGAGRGIGRGIAIELAAAGWSVAVNYRGNAEAAAEACRLCGEKAVSDEQRFVSIGADISDPGARESLLAECWAAFGGIDALVNNAGIAPRPRADILEASPASFEEIIKTNLEGPYFLTQAVARKMLATDKRSGPRAIVFVTSISAESASIARGDYCLSKAGLAMAAQLWALRLAGSGIRVYELRPGIMATDMTETVKEKYEASIAEGLVPEGRWGLPEDVGRAVRSLLAGDWPFSTGSVIHVDGGLHLSRL